MKPPEERVKERFFYLTGFLTLVYIGVQWYGFIQMPQNPTNYLPFEFSVFATIAVFGYTILKETFRWTKLALREYFGEILTHSIVGSYILMTLLQYFYPERFTGLPNGFFDVVVSIFLIWLGSRISKAFYEAKHKK